MTALIKTTSLTGFVPLVRELGGEPETLLRAFAIDPQVIDNVTGVIPYRSLIGLLEYSAEHLQCPDFGLQMASRQSISILGPLAVIAQNARTVGEALREVAHFMHTYSPGISLRLDTSDPERPQLEFDLRLPALHRVRQTLELSLGVAHRTLQMLYGRDFHCVAVLLRCSTPLPQSRYQHFFGANAYFAQECNALVLRPDHLTQPISEHNRQLHDTMLDYLYSLSAANPLDLHSQVIDLIKRLLPTRHCTLRVVAERMGLNERTLQRRLEAEQLVFEQMVDNLRRELTDMYLLEPHMPMAQIAALLGYAEQSSLNRACKRWHDLAPSARRHQLQQGA
ncbi:AraC family transcriptional regulator [Halopseudomonas maritima]|uniref:AraC family transcriptional regulator n=1 Tax=Halopseudomonas maritima TaxID=2918528 RepID=UPI001EEABE18|nr:AraC family transcriptional regulator [Halopseudomonas maritima]UJJ30250.1 AraC family transcriptional regulator [Halopseudomonas maritima]